VLGARWDEIDLREKVWIVPAARMKAGREHRVPLSDRAMAILN
jgi:integrase